MSHTNCQKDASVDCVIPFQPQTTNHVNESNHEDEDDLPKIVSLPEYLLRALAEKEGNQEASVCDEAMPAHLPSEKDSDKKMTLDDDPKREKEFTWPHHWVEGNLSAGGVCNFCSKPINPGTPTPK